MNLKKIAKKEPDPSEQQMNSKIERPDVIHVILDLPTEPKPTGDDSSFIKDESFHSNVSSVMNFIH